jgi:imidazolonepropionase-like amidohydrolase
VSSSIAKPGENMLLIKDGNIHDGLGNVFYKTDILISEKKIRKIGIGLELPDGEILDADGKEIFPGFIDPVTIMGCNDGRMYDNNEMTDPVTPDLEVFYAVERDHLDLQKYYEIGLTTMCIGPWNTNIFGGQMSIYKTFGETAESMLVKRSCILKGSVTDLVKKTYGTKSKMPMTKMGMFALLKKILIEADAYDPTKENTACDYKKLAVKKMLIGELPLFMAANRATEINSLFDVFADRPVKLTITSAYQAPKCVNKIKEKNVNLVLGDQEVFGEWNDAIDYDGFISMHHDGINISLSVTSDGRWSGREAYLWCAGNMYKAGLDPEEVVKMMTINPARILGLDETLGSLEEEKQADLVIYDGNPIKSYKAKTVATIIDGSVVYKYEK